jgi:hypothetical protein
MIDDNMLREDMWSWLFWFANCVTWGGMPIIIDGEPCGWARRERRRITPGEGWQESGWSHSWYDDSDFRRVVLGCSMRIIMCRISSSRPKHVSYEWRIRGRGLLPEWAGRCFRRNLETSCAISLSFELIDPSLNGQSARSSEGHTKPVYKTASPVSLHICWSEVHIEECMRRAVTCMIEVLSI